MNKTISEKLEEIAQNEQRVYEAGHDAGYTEGLNKGGYADGFEAGKQAEYDAFWEVYQQGGDRRIYTYAFYGGRWTDEIYNPKYPITIEGGNGVYQTSNVTDTKVPIDVTNIGNNGQVFIWAKKLVTIRKLIVGEDRFSASMFESCTALENITIEGVIGRNFDIHWSTKLSADSIRNIIEHLSDAAEGKTLTLSQTAVDNMDISDIHVKARGAFHPGGSGTFLPMCQVSMKAGERLKVVLDVEEGHHYTDTYTSIENMPDWAVGFSFNGNEPYNIKTIYVAERDETVRVGAYIILTEGVDFSFKMRAVFVDENGNEMGENIFATEDGDYTYTSYEGQTMYYTVKSGWAALEASKPNWTITLV